MKQQQELPAFADRFLELLLESGALNFGEFKTKSGRISPYFFNTGAFNHGRLLNAVAECYADLLMCHFEVQKIHLYGPAYKGIPLATATAQELSRRTRADVPFTFNRKEAKDHGEGGNFVGAPLKRGAQVIVIEDVMTGGTSVRETIELLKPIDVKIEAVVIGVDREERGAGPMRASEEFSREFAIPVYSILKLDEIVSALWGQQRGEKIWIDDALKRRIDEYRRQYC